MEPVRLVTCARCDQSWEMDLPNERVIPCTCEFNDQDWYVRTVTPDDE